MSGFLPDLASWALRGGAGNGDDGDEADQQAEGAAETPAQQEQLTEQEIRARRLARMEAMAAASSQAAPAAAAASGDAMIVDSPNNDTSTEPMPMEVSNIASPPRKKAAPPSSKKTAAPSPTSAPKDQQKKKKAKESHSPLDPAKKSNRKKELLIKKILNVTLTNEDPACVHIAVEDAIGLHTIAEVLATRVSLPKNQIRTIPSQKPLIAYLAQSHRKASDELKTMRQLKKDTTELQGLLEEIQRQLVSYAASSLMEPDLFEQAQDGKAQLAKLFFTTDPSQSITFGVAGSASSFYYLLCEELHSQDSSAFERVVNHLATQMMSSLKGCDSLESGVGESSPLGLTVALTSLCSHKKAALVVTKMDTFLLPPKDSPAANEVIRPSGPTPGGADLLRMLTGGERPYQKRSGPGLEKQTLLGLCLRIATPKNNPAFSPTSILRQSLDSVERTSSHQRQQLRVYQEACNQLIMALIKAGPDARGQVLQWVTDCMLVNPGATAMRPDPTKVSSSSLLLNVSVVLLKLCEPFVSDEKKHRLIDAGFVSSPSHHKGIYATTGDDALPRLGGTPDDASMDAFSPKNAFIPQCFFLTARSLALGIVPLLSQHENLLRHISHQHWELTSQNRDLHSDPHFSILVSRQRSNEVALFQEEMVVDTMRFCNLMAKVLVGLPDDTLKLMPEHFCDNICDILMDVAKMKPKILRGLGLRYVFQLVVKLLSPTYASMVRNYNLRAMLGDVLHELYLPSTGNDRRDVPSSVACDPMAGGQTFLLSDPSAQETLAPSLLLLYGEVEHTGYYDKMSHRAKISSLLKYLWESSEHRPAFRAITQNKESFIKFANGIINETNTLIATVMQKLPEIRATQEKMANTQEWGRVPEEEQSIVTSRLEDNEREVKHALPLCNKTLQMFGYLNTDKDIRGLFLLGELCPRLVNMLLHVLGKLVGSKGLDLKVNNPEQYEFRPKEMLRDLCAIFALFASAKEFQVECAKSGCNPELLVSATKTCLKLNLLTGESMKAFETLPGLVAEASRAVADDEELLVGAPDEFLDEIMSTFMMDPVVLPSGHFVDRPTITQHLLNDPIDPFNREEMTIEDVKPATELKERIDQWLEEKRAARRNASSS
eukprot:CAMPEP_0117009760 /NCGR_PEP_ID=MMETSP0472-20121206/8773_1 /TAXON_ID=693140 ORGANISM="Tiarina fusus, Strain LIS" /NCGR_SAMPLE_ID=MMETSP0472 /ASSEMBLY_ACC=CAM_ASM_000603 /LENGTH=1113 /DNA_ID=CAMNT_0004712117 /DNA_START=80 /DNA_END=3421 /DNA_ORIENTATION=-